VFCRGLRPVECWGFGERLMLGVEPRVRLGRLYGRCRRVRRVMLPRHGGVLRRSRRAGPVVVVDGGPRCCPRPKAVGCRSAVCCWSVSSARTTAGSCWRPSATRTQSPHRPLVVRSWWARSRSRARVEAFEGSVGRRGLRRRGGHEARPADSPGWFGRGHRAVHGVLDLSGVGSGETVLILVRGGVGLETDTGEFSAIPVPVG